MPVEITFNNRLFVQSCCAGSEAITYEEQDEMLVTLHQFVRINIKRTFKLK